MNLYWFVGKSLKRSAVLSVAVKMCIDFIETWSHVSLQCKCFKNYTFSSITKCMKRLGEYMTSPTVLHAADYKVVEGITYLPLYMLYFV